MFNVKNLWCLTDENRFYMQKTPDCEWYVLESDYYLMPFLFLPVLGGHGGCRLSFEEGWGAEI